MANRFWVGGTATWDGTAGSKWATTSGGAGGAAVPTTSDDVFFDANSTGVCTLATGIACKTLDCTGQAGSISHPSLVAMTVAGNLFKLASGKYTTTAAGTTARIDFTSTSGTCLITTAGNSLSSITFDGAGGTFQLQDAFTQLTTHIITLTRGTFDTNNQTCTFGRFVSSNSNTRVLTLGSSAITLQNGTATTTIWDIAIGTNMTLNSGTSSIVCRSSTSAPIFNGGSKTYYNVSITQSSGGFTLTGGSTFNNLTMDNTVLGGGNRPWTISSSVTQTINGTFSYIGANNNSSRGFISGGTFGTATTIALGTTGTAVLTNIEMRDIAFTGTNTPATGTSLGDGGGNSGITFDAPRTVYWIGNTNNLNDPAAWSATSGGAGGVDVPRLQDTARFDANSFTSAGRVVTNNMMRFGTIDFTGATNNPTYASTNPNGAGNSYYGSFILVAGMTYTASTTLTPAFNGRSASVLDHANVAIPTTIAYTVNQKDGSLTLQSNLTLDAARTLLLSWGTFNANGYNVTAGAISSSNSNARTINMGSGTWTASGTGTIWQFSTMTNLTFNSDTSTLVISDTSASTKTFAHGASITMYNVSITGSGSGSVIFGANSTSINDLTINAPKTVSFTAGSGSTTTIRNNFNAVGTAGNVITLVSGTPGSVFFLSKSSGAVISDYLSLTDSSATGGASWYAGANSTNVSNNRGWQFSNQDVSKANFFQMM